jgi:hypothetical protein
MTPNSMRMLSHPHIAATPTEKTPGTFSGPLICHLRPFSIVPPNSPAAHRLARSTRRVWSGGPVQPLVRDALRVSNHARQPRGRSGDAKRPPNAPVRLLPR